MDDTFLGSLFTNFTDWLTSIFGSFSGAISDIFMDGVLWLIDGFFSVVQWACTALVPSALSSFSWANVWAGLPGEVLQVLTALGAPQAFGMICAALLFKLALRSIPFLRL